MLQYNRCNVLIFRTLFGYILSYYRFTDLVCWHTHLRAHTHTHKHTPGILKTRKGNWIQPIITDSNDAEELSKPVINATSCDILPIDLNRCNNWRNILRVTAYVMRAVIKKAGNISRELGDVSPPTKEKIQYAKLFWIRTAQSELNCVDRQIEKLTPFKDKDGVIRIYDVSKILTSSISTESIQYSFKHIVSELTHTSALIIAILSNHSRMSL